MTEAMAERGQDYDAIVIGSGIGGLTAAALLSRFAGKRVLVLERHFKFGGFTHTFQRKGFHWDVGIHYLGQLEEGSTMRGLYDLVTGGTMKWQQMPHVLEVFHYPEHRIEVPSDPAEYLAVLRGAFPGNDDALARYFKDVVRVAKWYGQYAFSWSAPGFVAAGLKLAGMRDKRLGLMTTDAYLRKHFSDPHLRAVLTSQWGDHGLPPKRSAFAVHALIVAHYLNGGWFPVGSSKTIGDGAKAFIEGRGGACEVNHTVEQVLVEDGRAVGVRVAVKKGREPRVVEFRAPLVISDAGAQTTARHLLPEGTGAALRELVDEAEPSVTTLTLYLGLERSPESLGFHGENHWYFEGYDHDAMRAQWSEVLQGHPPGAYLSFPSLKDPEASRHTAEIICFAEYDPFASWADAPWRRRGAAYDELKETIADGMLAIVERHHPGFRDLVAYRELSTPLSVEAFTGHPAGSIYGLATTPDRLRRKLVPVQTEIPGLLLTGSDVCASGVAGAMMGGVFTAATVLGPQGLPRIMAKARAAASSP